MCNLTMLQSYIIWYITIRYIKYELTILYNIMIVYHIFPI